jgi:hypothetical protein
MKQPHTNIIRGVTPQEVAESEIDPYSERIARCLQAGPQTWEELVKLAPAQLKRSSERSKASFMYDCIADAIEREFEGEGPDVSVTRVYGSIRLNIKDILIAKFNRLNARGRPSRNNTYIQRAFFSQLNAPMAPTAAENVQQLRREEQQVLPGITLPTKIIIGWQLDKLKREITNILVSCPFGKENLWSFSIGGADEVEVIREFAHNAASQAAVARATVVPKKRLQTTKEQTS